MTREEADLLEAQTTLKRLNRMLSEYSIASDLIDIYGQETVGAALEMLEAKEAAEIESAVHKIIGDNMEDDGDSDQPTLRKALSNYRGARGNPTIKIGQNKTKTLFNGSPKKDPTKSFAAAGDKVAKISSQMAEDELPWASSSNNSRITAGKLRVIKDAVLKSVAAQKKGLEEAFTVNDTALAILRARALKEDNNTVAAQTIRTDGLPREDSIRPQLPPEFDDSKLLPAQRERSVSSMLPAEFTSAKKSTVADEYLSAAAKIKAGHVRSLSDAGKTLNRPTPVFDNKEANFEELPQPTTVKGSGKLSRSPEGQAKTRQPTEFDVDLAKPKKPGQYGDQLYAGQI
jgi:hypothetical protein